MENNVAMLPLVDEVKRDLVAYFKAKLHINEYVKPLSGANKITEVWLDEKNYIKFWPMVTYPES